MRLFNSTLCSAIAMSVLAGCSGNMATTPSAAVPGAAPPGPGRLLFPFLVVAFIACLLLLREKNRH